MRGVWGRMFETKDTTNNTQSPNKKNKPKGSFIVIILLLFLVVGMGAYIGNDYLKTKDLAPPSEDRGTTKPLEGITGNPSEGEGTTKPPVQYTSELFNKWGITDSYAVTQYLIAHSESINSLAIGFTTMASFLDTPETIVTVDPIKKDMENVQTMYEEIFRQLDPSETDNITGEEVNFVQDLADTYRQLFAWRLEQAKGLAETPEGIVVNYETTSKEAVTALWKEVIAMHADFKTMTDLDFTGGLGALMK